MYTHCNIEKMFVPKIDSKSLAGTVPVSSLTEWKDGQISGK